MSRIEKLTTAQIAAMTTYRDKWLAIGLAVGDTDYDATHAAIAKVYAAAGLESPGIFIHLGSPFAGAVGATILDQVRNQVGDQVRYQVGDQVGDQVRYQIRDQIRDQVGDQVRDQVWNQVKNQVGDQVRDQVWNQVRDQIRYQVRDQVRYQVEKAIYGLHDAGWLSFYDFFRSQLSLDCCTRLDGLSELARCAGWVWPFANVVIITPRPTALNRDDQGRLHNAAGPAILYPDGWSIYAWHGVRVNAGVIMDPVTVERIDREDNTEVRRVLLERFGADRYIQTAGAQIVHRDAFGELLRRAMPDDEDLMMVRVKNSTPEPDGSIKEYFLRVPPTVRTAHEAVAWTFERNAQTYQPDVET